MVGPGARVPCVGAPCRSFDRRGKSVYHTNVMMAIGTGVAIVCDESVTDAKERKRLLDALSKWGRDLTAWS